MGKAFSAASRLLAPLGLLWDQWRPTHLNSASGQSPRPQADRAAIQPPATGPLAAEAQRPVNGLRVEPPADSPRVAAWEAPNTPTSSAPQPPAGSLVSGAHGHLASPALSLSDREGAQARPLRVLRIREQRQSSRHAGRLVISGRMADVCAELERLANAHPGLLH